MHTETELSIKLKDIIYAQKTISLNNIDQT